MIRTRRRRKVSHVGRVERSSEIWHRGDFALLCEWRRLYRVVEVGVDRGEFAQCFLSRSWNCELYLAVDAYEIYPEMPWPRDGDFQMACKKLEPYRAAKIVRGASVEVAASIAAITESKFYSEKFGFVYLDGAHDKPSVAMDIEAWWPLVADNGILAGHDWEMKSGDHPGVKEAVLEFAESHDLIVYLTHDDPKSWYVYKSGLPGADWVRVPEEVK